jgi:predicted DNA-binding transcriptional regulator AlpA
MSDAHSSFQGENRLLDLDDMCRLFTLTPEAIYNRRHRGDFPPAIKVGASLRWNSQHVGAWLDSHRDGEASR